MSYAAEVLADSPYVYWRLDDSSAPVTDSSGNNFGGSGGVTYNVSGLLLSDPDPAIGVNSTNFIQGSDDLSLGGTRTAFTVECWVNASAWDTNASVDTLIAGFVGGDAGVYVTHTGHVYGAFEDHTFTFHPGTFSAISLNTTYHLAVTYDGTTIVLYINGILAHSDTVSAGNWAFSGTPAFFSVGAAQDGVFSATLDEAAFYLAALDGSRVLAHYNAGVAFGLDNEVGIDGSISTITHRHIVVTDTVGVLDSLRAIPSSQTIYTVNSPDYCLDPFYHPTGQKIIFTEKLGSAYNIATITTTGGSHTVILTNTTHPYFDPTYSPDGKYVLFSQQTAAPSGGHTYGDWAIRYIDPNNVVNTVVSDTNANMHPVWLTPTQVAFQRLRYGTDSTFHIVLADLAGTVLTDLGEGEYARLVEV